MGNEASCVYPDIYFEPAYARLYEDAQSRAVEYRFSSEYGEISNLFLRRVIPIVTQDGQTYYDLITPYGYGGPVIRRLAEGADKDALIAAYMADFQHFARENNIVAEFIRFHPMVGNGVDFRQAYNSVFDRKTVGTTLSYENVIETEFSKHRRKDIRRILKNPEIRYEVNEHPEQLDEFVDVYYSTMSRDQASQYYYFTKDYFRAMLASFPDHIITGKVFLGDTLIAMGVYFRYGKYLHAHLSGTVSEYMAYSPAYILKYALALYGHEKGYAVIHYGGGTSNAPDNSLYKFKREFGQNTEFDFYIGRKVWNEAIYRELCEKKNVNIHSDFFPAYRSER